MSDDREDDQDRPRPSKPAEWVTFGVSAAIVLAVIGAILLQVTHSPSPAAPTVAVGEVQERNGDYVVPVVVRNEGDETAENVQVNATLTLDDGEVAADQVIDFLAGGEREELSFVFEDDPGDGELEVVIGGFSLP
jgi:uncharacterized protein (TIGR02588 family)